MHARRIAAFVFAFATFSPSAFAGPPPGEESDALAPVEIEPAVRPPSKHELEMAALRERVEALEAQQAEFEASQAAAAAKPPEPPPRFVRFGLARPTVPPTTVGFGPSLGVRDWGVRISGYMQLQYQWSQLSEDQLQQGGEPLNQNRFMVRRGRLRINGDWQWAAFDFELDGSTTRGPFVGIRQANASFVWRNPDLDRPPLLMITAGLTEMPFGYEMRLGQREMPFMERSAGSLAMFPGPVDIGVRVRGAVAAFRYDLAIMGGTPYDDRAGGARAIDPTRNPDGMGRLGFEVQPKRFALAGGVSALVGTGFHPGQEAGKSRLEWVDFNENGVLNTGETVAVPGTPATPSVNFRRWAVGVDLQLGIQSKAGWSTLLAEATLASNLDRGFLIADPIAYGADLRELSAYVAFVQELFGWALVGARYDYYDPNTDLLDRRRGTFVPTSAAIHTFSPLAGALLPEGKLPGFRARLLFQYDLVWDRLGRDASGVPVNLRNDQFTLRVQGEF